MVDVALLPSQAARLSPAVYIVVDEIRASTTITTLLDLGCSELILGDSIASARAIAHERGSLLVGERFAIKPAGFDYDNSPTRLDAAVNGRSVVLCTTNGAGALRRLRNSEHVLVGCTRNATACALAAAHIAMALGWGIQVVCAGQRGRFVLDDSVAAGVIVERIVATITSLGHVPELSDSAVATIRLRESYPDVQAALEVSNGGQTLRRIGQEDDIPFCAAEDVTATVPQLLAGSTLQIVALASNGSA